MSRTDPQFNLRIPADLKSKVEEAARLNKRSATSEIIARLETSFRKPDLVEDTAVVMDEVFDRSIHVQKADGQIVIYTDDVIKEAILRAFDGIEQNHGPTPRRTRSRK